LVLSHQPNFDEPTLSVIHGRRLSRLAIWEKVRSGSNHRGGNLCMTHPDAFSAPANCAFMGRACFDSEPVDVAMLFHSFRSLGLVAAGLACMTVGANAKTLVTIKPGVLLSQGEGYVTVTGATPVAPGDTILVNKGGAAEIQCAPGQSLTLSEPGYYKVPIDCGPASAQDVFAGFEGLGAVGPLLLGGAVLGGAIAILESSEDSPASQ
jgi:hypothetical protein